MVDVDLVGIFVPLGICVALPVLIVWLVMRMKINADNRRSQVLIESIRTNDGADTDKIAEALIRPRRSTWEKLTRKILRGSVYSAMGLFFLILAIVMSANTDDYSPKEFTGMYFISCALLGVGIGFLVSYFVGKNLLKNQFLAKEEEVLSSKK